MKCKRCKKELIRIAWLFEDIYLCKECCKHLLLIVTMSAHGIPIQIKLTGGKNEAN